MSNKMKISKIHAYTIYDSRGNPTVEVSLETALGTFRASVPAGASTVIYETLESCEGCKTKYFSKGISKAIRNINHIIAPALIKKGFSVTEQKKIDEFLCNLDGTAKKERLGINAIFGVSMAVFKAGSRHLGLQLYKYIAALAGTTKFILPIPVFTMIHGTSHASNKRAEFMILPTDASSFSEAMRMGSDIYRVLNRLIKTHYDLDDITAGDKRKFAPNIHNNKEVFLILFAIREANYKGKVQVGIDVTTSELYQDGKFNLDTNNPNSSKATSICADALVYLISDTDIQIVGNNMIVTNRERIQTSLEKNAPYCLLLKVNQIGTVTESIHAHKLAKVNGWSTMVSHTPGETEDSFIADLAVGLAAELVKFGAPCQSEYLAKYNQILRIEQELGFGAKFRGIHFRNQLRVFLC
ncbi:enolase-like [Artemia franciscana]|uniref:enolase-like n=1 Tax=Artemia franciscana TaxID=6661 RepID=UPI0032DB524D